MDNWQQIPKKENLTFEEKAFNTAMINNKFTLNVLRSMDGLAINTGQFKMIQLQCSISAEDERIKKFLLSDKFITYLKNADLIEHIKKKETPFKDKSAKSSYYKGMFFTTTEKARILLDKMRGQF
jgi:hypothetical protein